MPWRSSSARGPMPESISSCGVLKAPPARITSREARISRRSPASRARPRVGAVEVPPLQVLDADGALVAVEQHARRERVELDAQAVGEPLRHVQHSLARPARRRRPCVASGR